ncbi:MAG: Anaerobic nitric oxide reductase transcription regulator NorR [Mycoplasmataceae bacterium]|nr:MAG: Anaerobic nitric oxide reductase transcription regulator NorR [Mycoplasmataceae bacterium]
MSGQNVNIYLQDKVYQQTNNLIKERKLSSLINKLLTDYLEEQKQIEKNNHAEEMKKAYQRIAASKNLKKEREIWSSTDSDCIW